VSLTLPSPPTAPLPPNPLSSVLQVFFAGKPLPPTHIEVRAVSCSSVSIHWLVSSDCHSGITHFIVTTSVGGDQSIQKDGMQEGAHTMRYCHPRLVAYTVLMH
jgi:hypothetical protein